MDLCIYLQYSRDERSSPTCTCDVYHARTHSHTRTHTHALHTCTHERSRSRKNYTHRPLTHTITYIILKGHFRSLKSTVNSRQPMPTSVFAYQQNERTFLQHNWVIYPSSKTSFSFSESSSHFTNSATKSVRSREHSHNLNPPTIVN